MHTGARHGGAGQDPGRPFSGPEEALGYLHGLFRPGVRSTTPLERMLELLRRLGNPEAELRTIHITGTNGKGSVAANVASVFAAAGYRTGLFVSPYLQRYGERIMLDGCELPDQALMTLLPRVRAAICAMVAAGWERPTEFEATTALAALYYRRERADVVSLEVGLGGRLDATNAIPRSLVSVITRVGLDHTDRLGPTVAAIAREKAGIIRTGQVVIAGRLRGEVLDVVSEVCRDVNAELRLLGRDFDVKIHRLDRSGLEITVRGGRWTYARLRSPLLGAHQADNVACAVAAIEAAGTAGADPPMTVDEDAVRRGVGAVRWPGRIELFAENPLVVLDGAHNPDAVAALARTIPAIFGRGRVVAVLGVLGDKAGGVLFSELMPLVSEVVVTTPGFAPRAMPAAKLAETITARFPEVPVSLVPSIPEALATALKLAGPDDMVLVTGSFYLIGDARTELERILG